jgi:hypothetical protein
MGTRLNPNTNTNFLVLVVENESRTYSKGRESGKSVNRSNEKGNIGLAARKTHDTDSVGQRTRVIASFS